ncbi:MAG: sugar ABC transporter substrate-binding protein [Bifidobacteriaceae bacterium]|jgi:ABC-type sugar transport system substrate-binding protein|nr:sugar ABC transporter substrate-binding protein [Bifidobacteriaceae bacterium]
MKQHLARRSVIAALGLSMVFVAGACGEPDESGGSGSASGGQNAGSLQGKKLLMVPYWLDNFDTAWANWVTRFFDEEGVEVTVINANANASRQLDAIDTAINGGQYDGIIWGPIDMESAATTVERIQGAGIPQLVFGASLDGVSVPQLNLDVDNALTPDGGIAAEYVLSHPDLGDHTRAVFLGQYPQTTDCTRRYESFVKGLEQADPDAEIVFNGLASNSADAADKMTDFITQGKDFNVYGACGAELGLGGLSAMKSAGLASAVDKAPNDVFIMTQDATPPELQELWDKDSALRISSLLPPKDGAEMTLDIMSRLLKGELPIDSEESALLGWMPITPDCAKYRDVILDQFEGVEGFNVPECSFEWTGDE